MGIIGGVLRQSPPLAFICHMVISKCGGRGQPESSVAWLRDLLVYLALLSSGWGLRSQVTFLTVTIHILVMTENMVE